MDQMMNQTITERIFAFAYGGALVDAIGQKAFESIKTPLHRCDSAKNTVKKYVDDILGGKTVDFYDVADRVEQNFADFISKYNQDQPKDKQITATFTFGNAQKLINMTVKNLFIVTYDRPDLRENFCQCHCPMDNIMVNCVVGALRNRTDLEGEIHDLTQRGWIGFLRRPWSKITSDDKTQYETFQKLVAFLAKENDVQPIAYDYLMWDWDLAQNDEKE